MPKTKNDRTKALKQHGYLGPQTWMLQEETQQLFKALTCDGGQARFVGGCVRDALLGRSVLDIDIATPLTPDQVIARLREANIKHVPTGIEHGTITAVVNGFPFEITTLRRDVKTDGRHAKVAFTTSWREDAERRDFTINALYATLDGQIYDPFGGIGDLRKGHVRFIGCPEKRIAEDVLRILRFFRFYAFFGRGDIDPAGYEACCAMADALSTLSAERVRNEVLKLLSADHPEKAWRAMLEGGILDVILPELDRVEAMQAMIQVEVVAEHTDEGVGDGDPLRRLVSLMRDRSPIAVNALSRKLRLSKAQHERMLSMVKNAAEIGLHMEERVVKTMVYSMGRTAFMDALFLCAADQETGERDENFRRVFMTARKFVPPVFPVKGDDVIKLGVAAGPMVGEILDSVEKWWLEQDFKPDRAACLDEIKRRINQR